MPPVGRPRSTTRIGKSAPTRELGVPDLGMGGYGYGVAGIGANPLSGANGPWRMYADEWEYVPELRWPWSIRTFDQMRTDSQLAGLLTGTMWGISQLRFVVDPNGCPPTMVREISQDLNLPVLGEDDKPQGRMRGRFSHRRFVPQALLSVIYGHIHFNIKGEIVDGHWRLRKLAPRMPHTIRQINVADDGGLVSIVQWAPVGWNLTNPGLLAGPEIPVDNLLAFIFQQEGVSQTGRSMLRDVYKDWLLKDRNLRVEAINHERAGGVPYAEGAQGMTEDEITSLDQMMRQFRIGDASGGAVPYGAKIHIAKGSGSDIDATIKRLDESMARRFLLMLVNLAQGGQHVGSYALGETFEDFFIVGQRHIAQWYCDTLTEYLIEDIIDWNYGEDTELTPRVTWERNSEDSLGTETLATLVQRGVITMDQELENWVRYRYLMPKKTESRPEVSPGGPRQQTEQQSQQGTSPATQTPAPAQAAGDLEVLPPASEPAEPSWLGKLMDKLTATLPFTHATPAVQVPPAQVHVEPHIHMPPAPDVTIDEGAVQVYPPDIHLAPPQVTVEPTEVNVQSPNITVEPAQVHVYPTEISQVQDLQGGKRFEYKDGLAAKMYVMQPDGNERAYNIIRDGDGKITEIKEAT